MSVCLKRGRRPGHSKGGFRGGPQGPPGSRLARLQPLTPSSFHPAHFRGLIFYPAPPQAFKMASKKFFTNRFKRFQDFFRKSFTRLFVCPVRTINMKTLCSLSFPVPAETSKNGKKLGFCVKSENCHVRFPAKPCIFRDSYYLIRIHHRRARLFEEGDMPELFTWAP